jgi:ribosomal protein L40E
MSVPRVWRLQVHSYRLEGSVCMRCGAKVISRRGVCPACQEQAHVRGGIPVEILASVPRLARHELVPVPVEISSPHRR